MVMCSRYRVYHCCVCPLFPSNNYEFYYSVLPIVGLTIGGTYLLFTQGSTVALKALQKRKQSFYTYPNMFVLSNLIYKMKDNARFYL